MAITFKDIYCTVGTVFDALVRANRRHDELGTSGLEMVKKNQFGETALRADVEAEKAVLNECREHGLSLRIMSEEHGLVNIVENPLFLGVLDGIDGTAQYKKGPGKTRYGTLFAVFEGDDPCYNDYIASGLMEHSSHRLLVAIRNMGTSMYTLNADGSFNTEGTPVKCSNKKELEGSKFYIDEYYETNRKVFSEKLAGFETSYLCAFSVYFFDLVTGTAEFSLQCTAKRNLEHAAAYGLIKEAGGVMVTMDGEDIGPMKYLEFGQGKDEQIPVIAAANIELAEKLIEHLRRNEK